MGRGEEGEGDERIPELKRRERGLGRYDHVMKVPLLSFQRSSPPFSGHAMDKLNLMSEQGWARGGGKGGGGAKPDAKVGSCDFAHFAQ